MATLGLALMIVGVVAVAAALLTLAGPGLREIGFVLLGGVASTRGALPGGTALIVAGAVRRQCALRARGR